jgi:hypothetical protein
MGKIKFTDVEYESAKRMWGYSDEDMNKVIPQLNLSQKRFFQYKDGFHNNKMIMEVVEVKNCPRQAVVGGRIVFSGMGELIPSECTAFPVGGFCTKAVMAMLPFCYMAANKVMAGLSGKDLVPALDFAKCPHGTLEEGISDLCVSRFIL